MGVTVHIATTTTTTIDYRLSTIDDDYRRRGMGEDDDVTSRPWIEDEENGGGGRHGWWFRETARVVEAKTRAGRGAGMRELMTTTRTTRTTRTAAWDVVVTSGYLKVNAASRLRHVDLFDDVDDETATVRYEAPDVVIFRCHKRVVKLWGQLHRDGDKNEIMARRAASLRARAEFDQRADERAEADKKRIAREFLERQWAADDARKQRQQQGQRFHEQCTAAPCVIKPRRTTQLRARPGAASALTVSRASCHVPPPPRAFIHIPVTLTPVERLPARAPSAMRS